MRTCLSFLMLLCLLTRVNSQVPAYYHDTTLDSINNNIGILDDLPRRQSLTNHLVGQQDYQYIQTNTDVYGANYRTQSGFSTNVSGLGTLSNEVALGFIVTNTFVKLSSNLSLGMVTPGSNTVDGATSATNGSVLTIASSSLGFSKSLDFSLNNSSLPASFSSLSLVVRVAEFAFMWFWFFRWSVDELRLRVSEVLMQKQTQGSSQEILGVNASSVIGISYAVVTTVLIATVIGAVFSGPYFLSSNGGGGSVPALLGQLTGFANNFVGWDFVTAWFPIFGLFTIFVYYFLFTRFFMWPLFMFIRCIIFFLPA